MAKVKKMNNRNGTRVVVAISILIFAGMSLASDGDEDLLRQAKQIFGSLPQVILSEKNPVTPERSN